MPTPILQIKGFIWKCNKVPLMKNIHKPRACAKNSTRGRKNTKSIKKKSVSIRTQVNRESKNMSARVNTTESRTWTNERKKLELTCIQGPEETEVSANGPAVQYNGLKVALRWRAYLGAQDHSLQWGDLQTASTEQPYKKWGAVSPRLRKYWVLKPNLFSNVQISNPFKKENCSSLVNLEVLRLTTLDPKVLARSLKWKHMTEKRIPCLVLVRESTQQQIITASGTHFGSTEYRRGPDITMTSFCLGEARLSKGQTEPMVDILPLWLSVLFSSLIFNFVWRPLFLLTTKMFWL